MKNQLLTLLTLFSFGVSQAQVEDISFTISPVAEYTFFDKQAGLENAFSAGGKIGFGFGEYLELRAVYLQSIGLETDFSNYGLANYDGDLFTQQSVNLKRYGGEIKANLSSGRFIPYLTIGSGVQEMKLDDQDDLSQIYFNAGLGVKTKITDRIVFTLEGKYQRFNFNAAESLLTPQNAIDFDIANSDTKSEGLNNFMAQASLQFYLGGRKPGTLSALDSSYVNKFKNGLRGTQIIIEPSLNYVAFDKKASFRDTYLLGLYAGLDFNSYLGVRAFYLRAMADEKISFNFDPLSMYGLELRARLNDGNGVTPYIILGGGYMSVTKNYTTINAIEAKNQEFAQGGLGLNIPLGKRILITGGVRAMITSGTNVQDVASTDDLQTHLMYNAGIKVSLGGNARKTSVQKTTASEDLFIPQDFDAKSTKNTDDSKLATKTMALKKAYETELQQVNANLKKATDANDLNSAVKLLERKRTIENALYEVNAINDKLKNSASKPETTEIDRTNDGEMLDNETSSQGTIQNNSTTEAPTEYLKLTPAEFESLIDTVLKSNTRKMTPAEENEILKKRIDTLEKVLKQKEAAKAPIKTEAAKTPKPTK